MNYIFIGVCLSIGFELGKVIVHVIAAFVDRFLDWVAVKSYCSLAKDRGYEYVKTRILNSRMSERDKRKLLWSLDQELKKTSELPGKKAGGPKIGFTANL